MAVLINDSTLAFYWNWIEAGMRSANIKHPNYSGIADPVRSAALVCEEAGEAVAEALDATRIGTSAAEQVACLLRLESELVDTIVAAMCLLVSMKKEGNRA